MSKNTQEVTKNGSLDSVSKLEAIKDLIFGENIKEYDSEFEFLKKDILKKKEELKSLINETHQELNTLIDNTSTDLNIRITALEDSIVDKTEDLAATKVDKKTLGQLLVKLGNQISE